MEISFTSPNPQGISPSGAQAQGGSTSFNYATRKANGSIDWLNVILMLIAGGAVLVTLLLAVWHVLLQSSIDAKKTKLSAYEERLSHIPLQDIKKVSSKLKLANTLAKEYPYVTNIFQILEDSVDTNVTYSNFDMHYDLQKGGYLVSLSGTAPDYKTLAMQMDLLKSPVYATYISGLSLEGLHPNSKGGVDFGLKMGIGVKGIAPDMLVLTTASSTVRGGTVSDVITPSNGSTPTASSSPNTKPGTSVATSTPKAPSGKPAPQP
jgi:hypothetical protein